jgi:DNA-binding CsgD family transcriptional regulator
MLRAADGLIAARRLLSAVHADDARALARLVAEAGRPPGTGGAVRITRPSGRAAYAAIVAPLGASHPPIFGTAGAATVLVMVSEPDRGMTVSEAELGRLFGLTRAEARVAVALVEGRTAEEIAAAHGVTLATIRTQVQATLTKTQSRRQADLLRLLLSFPAFRR